MYQMTCEHSTTTSVKKDPDMKAGLTFFVAGIHFTTDRTRIPFQALTTLLCKSHHQRDLSVVMATTNSIGGTDDDNTGLENGTTTPRIDSIERVCSTKWLALDTYNWTDQDGQSRKWDVAVRTTTSSKNTADAVVVIPILRCTSQQRRMRTPQQQQQPQNNNNNDNDKNPEDTDDVNTDTKWETLLVEQYRPPLKRTTLEFPAGLIDEGETVADAALRELREETGFVGEKCTIPPLVSRPVAMSPGLTNEAVHIVVVEVDLENPYNHGTPKPQLDDGEHCTVIRLPLTEGLKTVLDDETNAMPIMGLYMFALGLEMGTKMH